MNSGGALNSISGIFAPTITAYRPDGSIHLDGTRKFVRFLLDEGVDGLTPLGSAGEPVAHANEGS
ncbi:MAG: dihydrodipicolinate synthase family protein [Acidobacteria bacterium]|nr:dihydrodipicolinate synthase family protein [Acidobacteriota bacterium]MCI0720984.1 dihydrodipicolinate synthase family protein [Acidobacteriota bacterium]